MPDQCYYSGEFYQCATAASAGESPASAPAKWRRVQIPSGWRWMLARLTYSNLLELDGQKDKANAERALAVGGDRVGLEDMIRGEGNAEIFLERPVVRQREHN